MNIFFIHGFRANHELPLWFTWLSKELQAQGMKTIAPDFPSPHKPQMHEWVETIFSHLPKDEFSETIFVAHSLGGAAILRALEQDNFVQAAHVYLVGVPVDNVEKQAIANFFEKPFEFEKIRARSKKWTCIYSKNDPHVPFEHGLTYEKALGAELMPFEDRGHFEMRTFPELLTHLTHLYAKKIP
ncbi:alpha/beta hydrolase [Candidatus Gracilibacteria bacterium]|nr:alpha/beta hydrolase [Candidatus Gracilibacteria bacterium]